MTLSKNIVVFGTDDKINKQIDKLKEEYTFSQWRVKEYDNSKDELCGFTATANPAVVSVYGCDASKQMPYSWDIAYVDNTIDKMWIMQNVVPRKNTEFSELHFF